jgi:hypothetical protein
MNNIRPYIIPFSIIVVTTTGFAGLDIITPQETADFRLAPGFGRRVESVKTSELKKESSSYWGCPSPNHLNSDNIYFNQENRYTLYLEKDFDTSSINITVESKSGNTDIDTDPVIIIKPLDKDIEQKCQDKLDRQDENLNPEEEENTGTLKSVPLKLTQKGTYLMWIANEYDTKDEGTYLIKIDEQPISKNW